MEGRTHENAVSEKPASPGRQGARQTLGKAVLNIPQGQCLPCNAAVRTRAVSHPAGHEKRRVFRLSHGAFRAAPDVFPDVYACVDMARQSSLSEVLAISWVLMLSLIHI